jgi:hypothetical protein
MRITRWLLGAEQFCKPAAGAAQHDRRRAKSGLWCQIHADVLNWMTRQVKDLWANVRGAGSGRRALGHMKFDDFGRVEIAGLIS